MAQLVVRNLEDEVKRKLQRRARRHGRSMEEEVRDILRNAADKEEAAASGNLGSKISALFHGLGWDKDIPELRGHPVRPISFEP